MILLPKGTHCSPSPNAMKLVLTKKLTPLPFLVVYIDTWGTYQHTIGNQLSADWTSSSCLQRHGSEKEFTKWLFFVLNCSVEMEFCYLYKIIPYI